MPPKKTKSGPRRARADDGSSSSASESPSSSPSSPSSSSSSSSGSASSSSSSSSPPQASGSASHGETASFINANDIADHIDANRLCSSEDTVSTLPPTANQLAKIVSVFVPKGRAVLKAIVRGGLICSGTASGRWSVLEWCRANRTATACRPIVLITSTSSGIECKLAGVLEPSDIPDNAFVVNFYPKNHPQSPDEDQWMELDLSKPTKPYVKGHNNVIASSPAPNPDDIADTATASGTRSSPKATASGGRGACATHRWVAIGMHPCGKCPRGRCVKCRLEAPPGTAGGADVILGPCACKPVTVRPPGVAALATASRSAAVAAAAAAADSPDLVVGAAAGAAGGAVGAGGAAARAAAAATSPPRVADGTGDAGVGGRGAGSSSDPLPTVTVVPSAPLMASARCPQPTVIRGYVGAPVLPVRTRRDRSSPSRSASASSRSAAASSRSVSAVSSSCSVLVTSGAKIDNAAVVGGTGHTHGAEETDAILMMLGIEPIPVRAVTPDPFPWPSAGGSTKRSRSAPPSIPSTPGKSPALKQRSRSRRDGDDGHVSIPPSSSSSSSDEEGDGDDAGGGEGDRIVDGGFTSYPEDAAPTEPLGPLPGTPAAPGYTCLPRTVPIMPPTPDYPSRALAVLTESGKTSPLQKHGLQNDDASKSRRPCTKSAHADSDALKLAPVTGGVVTLVHPEADGATHALGINLMWWLVVNAGRTVYHIDPRRSRHCRGRVVTIMMRLPIGRGTVELVWMDKSKHPIGRGTVVTYGNKLGLNLDWGDDPNSAHRFVFRGGHADYEEGVLAAFLVVFITPAKLTTPRCLMSTSSYHVQGADWSSRRDAWSKVFGLPLDDLTSGATSPLDLVFQSVASGSLLPSIDRVYLVVEVVAKKYANSAPSRAIGEWSRASAAWRWFIVAPTAPPRPSDVWIVLRGSEVSVWQVRDAAPTPAATASATRAPRGATAPRRVMRGAAAPRRTRGGRGGGRGRSDADALGSGAAWDVDMAGDALGGSELLSVADLSLSAGTGAGQSGVMPLGGSSGGSVARIDAAAVTAAASSAAENAATTVATQVSEQVRAAVRDFKDEINGLRSMVNTERTSREAAEAELRESRSCLSDLRDKHADLREKAAELMGHCKVMAQRLADARAAREDVDSQYEARISALERDKDRLEAELDAERRRAELATERGQQMGIMHSQLAGSQLLAMAGKSQPGAAFPTPQPVSFPEPTLTASRPVSRAPVASSTSARMASSVQSGTVVQSPQHASHGASAEFVTDGSAKGKARGPTGGDGDAHPADHLGDLNAVLSRALGSR